MWKFFVQEKNEREKQEERNNRYPSRKKERKRRNVRVKNVHRGGRSSVPRCDRDDPERWFLDEEINLISWNASVASCDKTSTIIESIEAETNRRRVRLLVFPSSSILTLLPCKSSWPGCLVHRDQKSNIFYLALNSKFHFDKRYV